MHNVNWLSAAQQLSQRGEAYVLITLLGVAGSTPRNSGTKMLVSAEQSFATIGGGHLEYKAIAFAHKMLSKSKQNRQDSQHIEHFQLAAQLGQCCGGSASVLFECFAASRVNIMLFGAGHVGQALVRILAALPVKVTWVDNRAEQFQQYENISHINNISCVVSENPSDEIASMPSNSYFIVMTHNHQLDFELCQTILKQAQQQKNDFAYLGLIASNTKWRRFQQRFAHQEIAQDLIARINCPIGLSAVQGKKPMEVAVSIAGELIQLYQGNNIEQSNKGVQWSVLKSLLADNEVSSKASNKSLNKTFTEFSK
jgi:xanthine dehydrogenase accessory factor